MKQNSAYTFERFMYEVFERSRWINAPPLDFDAMLKRVREAYPKKKFTRADFLQWKHRFETGGI